MLGVNLRLDLLDQLTCFRHLAGRGTLSIYGCRAGESIVRAGAFDFATFCTLCLFLGSTACWFLLLFVDPIVVM
jgi:hypothetical protein